MDAKAIDNLIATLERARASVLIAPPKSGKSTYIPLKIYNEVIKRNPNGRVFVVEGTEHGAKTLSGFASRIQKNTHAVKYLDESTDLDKLPTPGVVYMSLARLVQIFFDWFNDTRDEAPPASVIVIANAFIEDLFSNVVQYVWYKNSLKMRMCPFLLFTSSIEGNLAVIRDYETVEISTTGYSPPEIVYSSVNSTSDTIAKDLAESIAFERRTSPQDDRYLIFVPTGFVMSQVESLLDNLRGLVFIISEKDTEVPHGKFAVAFDSCLSLNEKKIVSSLKNVCETRAGYAKKCKRMLTEEKFASLAAGRRIIANQDRLLRVALYLVDARIGYKSFFEVSKIPRFLTEKVSRTIAELELVNDNELNERGVFVGQLPLDGFCSCCLYELLKSRKNIYPEIVLFAAITVCGMNLFPAKSDYNGYSDLEVLAQATLDYMSSVSPPKEFARKAKLNGNYLREIRDKTDAVIGILFKLNFDIDNKFDVTDGEELVKTLEPTLKEVYKTKLMRREYGDMFLSSGKLFEWRPSRQPDNEHIPPESLIPLITQEFNTKSGIKRVVTLGHPINDLDVGETALDIADRIFDDIG